MQKSLKTLDTQIELLAESLASYLCMVQRCLLVCLSVCFILSANGPDYCDIVSLFLVFCMLEFQILIAIDQCYVCLSASTRATPERAGSHSGGPSLRGTLLHSPASSQARLVRFPICTSRSGKLWATTTSSSLSVTNRSSSGSTPEPMPTASTRTPALRKGSEASLNPLLSAACVCFPSVMSMAILGTPFLACGKTSWFAFSRAKSIRVKPLS